MDLSFFTLFGVIVTGAALSAAVWAGGLLIRRRLRGPARMILMTAVLILWYLQLYPLLTTSSLEPATQLAYRIGVHSIWIWWIWALMRFISRAKAEAGRTNIKTGLYKATGVHRITAEMRKTAERRRAEQEVEKRRAADTGSSPEE
jgi:hypothetical protein